MDWLPLMSALEQDFFCLAPDLPGHGSSLTDNPYHYSFDATCQELLRLLQQYSLQSCGILGYSMGGRLALYCALHFSAYCSALVLESASPGIADPIECANRRLHDEQLAAELEQMEIEPFINRWYEQPLFVTLRHHINFPALLQRRYINSPAGLALSLRALGTGAQEPLWKDLPQMKQPVLLLSGALDEKFTTIQPAMVQALPQAIHQVVPDCGHVIHYEQEERFICLVRNFLENHIV